MQLKTSLSQTMVIVILLGVVFFPALIFARTDVFTRTLYVGMRGEDVRELQKFLNTNSETRVTDAGVGSLGNETDYFGSATKRALAKFQDTYRTEILLPIGLTSGTGILGAKTREKINTLLEVANSATILPNSIQGGSAPLIPNTITPTLLEHEQAIPGLSTGVGIPMRLKISKINVNAVVEHVGLTSDGNMSIPKGPAETAWFNLGPRPGENGSAVISGHYGWKDQIPAVFDNLHKLVKGDKIYVEDEIGVITTFVVRELKVYGEYDDASNVFNSSDGGVHLNLITCQGTWNKSNKSYSNRLVVFADKVY